MALGFILITTEPGEERSAFDRLVKLPDLSDLTPLFGEYDFIARVDAPDFDALDHAILHRVRTIPGIAAIKVLTGTRF